MSGSDSDSRPKRPSDEAAADDPWAKWRKPDAPAAEAEPKKALRRDATVNPEKRSKSKSVEAAPVRAVRAEVPVAAPTAVDEETPALPEGTLGVRRSATPSPRAINKKPLRGGSSLRKPSAPKAAPVAPATPAEWSVKADRPERAAKSAPVVRPPVVREGPPPEGVRLSKVMSERGMCSRREADLWIERGWVFVDGERVSELGSRIDPNAQVSISKEAKFDQAKQVTVLLNKPVGYVSGQPEPGFTPAITLITPENQVKQSGDPEFKPWMLRSLAPSGRLDIDSTGLLVLTQDGRVAKKLIGDDSQVEKEYLVRVAGQMIKGGLDLLNHGLELDGQALKPARVKQLNEDQLHFILKEGKKRQIRRMCELVGLRVIGLKRVRIGRVKLGELEIGQWRFLRADEAF
ncbi:MAG: pseudouridine synthase [Gammaproteobacteria bacterium]|nr:pseudouridine synthase [Gammaproteobacteria bacterium]MBU1601097.1 pseudouridine synthase [Gammaproteobacteria bacterium]MBU2434456.1 pseudouridine synthase [Gammaproteobacteria bacterium]MBU2450860.1 pseudouridine synthase [Gammaproteobacteria bacterium]